MKDNKALQNTEETVCNDTVDNSKKSYLIAMELPKGSLYLHLALLSADRFKPQLKVLLS